MTTKWFATKHLQSKPISRPQNINTWLNKGYVVTEINEAKTATGSVTKIRTYSPRTREQYRKAGGK